MNAAKFIAFKFRQKQKHIKYQNLKAMISAGMINGPRLLEALLLRIRYAKDIFLIELELGNEVIIPPELSQD